MLKALALMGQLGYGYNRDSFLRAVDDGVDYIGVDAGSIDSGPYFLGSGRMKASYEATRRDLEFPLLQALKLNIPFIVGSAGYAGADEHLHKFVKILSDIAADNSVHFDLFLIHSQIDKEFLKSELKKGNIHPYEGNRELTESDIDRSTRIVAQMGAGRFIEGLKNSYPVIVAGRATDASIYAAYPLLEGYRPELCWHMAKIIECGALCAKPASASDALVGRIDSDAFYLEPPNPERRCTPESAMAHALYENIDPFVIQEPDGVLNLRGARYEAVSDRCVKIWGATWQPSRKIRLKLEGAAFVGYRSIAIAGIRDPYMIRKLDCILDDVKDHCVRQFGDDVILNFRLYGKDGVLGGLEFDENLHEIGLVIDVVAAEQELAHTVCSVAKSAIQHYDYEGRIATGANLAFPYSPAEFDLGEVYEFSVYHLLDVDSYDELITAEVISF